MALRLEWVGIAEADAADARQAMTLVGVNQAVQVAARLPMPVQLITVILGEESGGQSDAELNINIHISVVDEDEETLVATTGELLLSAAAYKQLPRTIQMTAGVRFHAKRAGKYTIKVKMNSASGVVEGEKSIYVVIEKDTQVPSN